jgi:hypothetical protein
VVKECFFDYLNFVLLFFSSFLEGLSDISSCVYVAVVSVQDEDDVWFGSILLFVPV